MEYVRNGKHITAVAVIVMMLAGALFPARELAQADSESKQQTVRIRKAEVKKLRKLLLQDSSIPASCGTRASLVKTLLALGASSRELVEAAGNSFCGPDPLFYYQLASALNERGEYLAEALQYAEWAYRRYENDGLNLDPTSLIVSIRIKRAEYDWVIRRFSKAARWDSYAFAWLGFAYERSNMIDEAIAAYIQSAGARDNWQRLSSLRGIVELPNYDLQVLYQNRYGSLEGLSERLEAARRAAWQSIHVDPYRIESPSFVWTLRDLNWSPVGLSDYKNKIVVLCFLETEYKPALVALKRFQQSSERYKDSGVVFLVVDVDRQFRPLETRRQKVPEALKEAGITLPVLMEYSDNVRRLFFRTGWTAGIILIDRNHEHAFYGGIFHDGPEKLFKVLDYLIEEETRNKK
jgi:tetratricopeptide (TPR) repeat protein